MYNYNDLSLSKVLKLPYLLFKKQKPSHNWNEIISYLPNKTESTLYLAAVFDNLSK